MHFGGMADALLADTDIEDALSGVYVSAVATISGYTVAHRNFDRDGVDLTIEAGSLFRPKLDLQLKASINIDDGHEEISFFCPKRNFDLLRLPTQVPRLLVVMKLPATKDKWLEVSPNELILRKCVYWVSLSRLPESANKTGETVYIPTTQRFDQAALQSLMERSRTGSLS